MKAERTVPGCAGAPKGNRTPVFAVKERVNRLYIVHRRITLSRNVNDLEDFRLPLSIGVRGRIFDAYYTTLGSDHEQGS